MRPLKFRAWDKQAKEMRPVTLLEWLYIDDDMSLQFETVHTRKRLTTGVHFPDEVELMQYTGLKDKNGTEIFDRDILTIDGHDFSPMDFVVEWSEVNHCWWLTSTARDEFGLPIRSFSFSELNGFKVDASVIGNIYENAELLESTNGHQ